jgi:hypothetical protein
MIWGYDRNRLFWIVPFVLICCQRGLFAQTPFLDQARSHFAQWDTNKDGEISATEIDRAISNPKTQGPTAAAAVSIRRALKGKKIPVDHLTMDKLVQSVPRPADQKTKIPDYEGMYNSALKKIHGSRTDLFGTETPNLDSISQGRLGDCYCLAPLGAMLHRNPNQVKSMFTPSTGGKVIVHLGKEKVEVPPLTDGELALFASTKTQGIWVQTYEKAMGIHLAAKKKQITTPIGAVGAGGSAGTALGLITGHRFERFSCKPFKDATLSDSEKKDKLESLRKGLGMAVEDKRLICGGTPKEVKVPGVTPNHAYAILNYDKKTDLVTFWNPHGQNFKPKGEPGLEFGYLVTKGKFQVPLKEAVTWIVGFSWEMAEPKASAK